MTTIAVVDVATIANVNKGGISLVCLPTLAIDSKLPVDATTAAILNYVTLSSFS